MLYGRDAELQLLSDLTSRSLAGAGGALLLRGEAGIGKTALLDAAREAIVEHGGRALSAVGVQSEAPVPFAGLHQLLRPVLDRASSLMPRQQQALFAAFGMAEGVAPEMFSVGLASLELISGLVEDSPVVLVIDDVQWVDRPSSEVLAFIVRRLGAGRAVMLLAVREGHEAVLNDAGLPELQVECRARSGLDARRLSREARHLGRGQLKPKLTAKIVKGPMTCTHSRSLAPHVGGRAHLGVDHPGPTRQPAASASSPAAAGMAGGLRPAAILGSLTEVRVLSGRS